MGHITGINTITACSVCYGWGIYCVTLGYRGTVGKERSTMAYRQQYCKIKKIENNLANLAEKLSAKCLSNVLTVCILAYKSWLPVTVRSCWFSAAQVCACIDTVHVCIGYGFPQYKYVFHSTGYGLPQHMCVLAVFTVRVCTGRVLPQHVCVLTVFTIRVCTGYGPPAHVCAGSFHSTCVYWLCPPTARVCAGSFVVCVCTGHGLPQHMHVLAVFTVRVCTGYVLPQLVCVLAVLQYVCVLVMVSHSTH